MRKTLITALLFAALPVFAEHVSPETAQKVAVSFFNNNGMKSVQLTDLTQAAGFEHLYIFNANPGFVVMAADNRVKPILGYSFKNPFVVEGMPENIRGWLQGYDDQIQEVKDLNLITEKTITAEWQSLIDGTNRTVSDVVVEPLLTTQWSQGSPYNSLCPSNSVTGCVATAMAQVMKYHNYPTKGIGFHSYIPETHPEYGTQTVDFNSIFYDWANMFDNYGSSSTPDQQLAVATLMYSCGVSVDMKYDTKSSSASTASVADALKSYFGYSSDVHHELRSKHSDSEWIALLKADLDLHRPIQYYGNGDDGGHSFVCDGYREDNYFHFNWGWGGNCDDYYLVSNLNPGPGGIGSGAYGIYNDSQGAILGIHPSECSIAAPANLSYNINGLQDLSLCWEAAEGANIYNIYRNNNYIGNSASTSFSETAPFGTNVYYIRSVDANGEMSLSSNAVSITIDYQTPIVNDLKAVLSENSVNLQWNAPQWCFPRTESAILTYGDGTPGHFVGYGGTNNMYWGHRYLPSDLAEATGKVIYKVSFYVRETGVYELYIFEGTTTNGSYDIPTTLIKTKTVTATVTGWFTIDLEEPVIIDPHQDLWVMMYDPEAKQMPAEFCRFYEHDRGGYVSTDIGSLTLTDSGLAWLIRSYLTDGTYTYNLYDESTTIANAIAGTSYIVENLANNTSHQFTVKTNYYGGESDASNSVGITIGSATICTLDMDDNDQMTVTQGSTLTVDQLTNDHPENLIIEDGGQLIHSSTGVKATVKQSIAAYTNGKNGWRLVSVPVADGATPSDANGWLNGSNYDLYYYDEPTRYWKNIKATGSGFDIDYTKGYLYANSDGTQLQSAGTLQPSVEDYTVKNLSYTNTLTSLRGFNLVGNPFVCNATVNKDFYVMNPAGTEVELAANDRLVAPCEGIFVVATENDRTVTFSRATAKSTPGNCIDVILTKNDIEIDRARVRFGDDDNLEKFNMSESSTRLYFPDADKDFAVVYTHPESELPLNFQADSEGSYHLSVDIDGVELAYLHLIDNLTGADIDLLTTPDYAFDARANDYASRFQLRFTERNTNENNIPSDFIEGDLQILDVTGRVVGTDPQMKLTPGVYVIRSVKSDEIKTKKIIIK